MLNFSNQIELEPGKSPNAQFVNFSDIEDGFIWQNGKWGEVIFDFEEKLPIRNLEIDIILELDSFKFSEKLPGQNVFFYLNGIRVGSFFVDARKIIFIPIESELLKKKNTLTIDAPDSVCPKKFGLNDDRTLGIQLFSLQIRKAD